MMRLALVLAAATFGTGCVFVDDDDDVCHTDRALTLQWDFQDFDGAIRGCTASLRQPVDSVDVWVDGFFVTSFSCFSGAGTIVIGPGTPLVTVEGISGNTIAYRHEFFANSSCGDQLVSVRPAQGTLAVDYSFSPTNACATPPTFVWIAVQDEVTASPVFFEGTGSRETCSTVLAPPEYVLPAGPFTFLGAEEVAFPSAILAADCTLRPFDIAGGLVTTVAPVLVEPPVACF
jgi:hypothetical protein